MPKSPLRFVLTVVWGIIGNQTRDSGERNRKSWARAYPEALSDLAYAETSAIGIIWPWSTNPYVGFQGGFEGRTRRGSLSAAGGKAVRVTSTHA